MSTQKSHWERAYSERSPLEVSWCQAEPTLSLELIDDAALEKDAPIIDVGGGASTLVDHLLAEVFSRVAVLDISGAALAHARARLGPRAGAVEWYETDVTEFKAPHPFVLWHDRATLHFLLDPVDRKAYFRVLKQSLAAGGHVVIATFAVGGPTKCSGLEIVQYDAGRMADSLGGEFRLLSQRDETHITPWHTEQRFTYFHFTRSMSATSESTLGTPSGSA